MINAFLNTRELLQVKIELSVWYTPAGQKAQNSPKAPLVLEVLVHPNTDSNYINCLTMLWKLKRSDLN